VFSLVFSFKIRAKAKLLCRKYFDNFADRRKKLTSWPGKSESGRRSGKLSICFIALEELKPQIYMYSIYLRVFFARGRISSFFFLLLIVLLCVINRMTTVKLTLNAIKIRVYANEHKKAF